MTENQCRTMFRAAIKGTKGKEHTYHQCILQQGHAEGDRATDHKTPLAGKMVAWRHRFTAYLR